MAINVNLGEVPVEFVETGKDILKVLNDFKDPEIVETTVKAALEAKDMGKVAAVTAEDTAKFLPALFRNDFCIADDMCNIGHALADTVHALAKVDRKAGLAIGLSVVALGGVGYLWKKYQAHEVRIHNLEQAIAQMQNGTGNAIGF